MSYSHEDEELVFEEVRWLQDNGINVWWDEGISPGAEWRDEVTQALQGCSLILYFITPHSVESGQCRREINFGLDQYRRPVLAVHLLAAELPDALGLVLSDRQAILKSELDQPEYERKLVTAIATYLDQPLSTIANQRSSRRLSPPSLQSWGMVLAALVVGALGMYLARQNTDAPAIEGPSYRFSISAVNSFDRISIPLISPDGKHIVFTAWEQGVSSLYVRQVDSFDVAKFEGTENARFPFLSYDGNWVVFQEEKKLFKTRIEGDSRPIEFAELEGYAQSAVWGPDDHIYFPPGWNHAVMRIPAEGGPAQQVTQLQEGEIGHWWPSFIPGTRLVLFTIAMKGGSFSDNWISVVDLENGEVTRLFHGSLPRYVGSGHIIYSLAGTYYAAPFDPHTLQELGEHTPVLEDVTREAPMGSSMHNWSVSDSGLMAYFPPGESSVRPASLVWVDRNGELIEQLTTPHSTGQMKISNDETRLAMTVLEKGEFGIEILDLERSIPIRFEIPGNAFDPYWGPNDEQLIFTRLLNGFDVYQVAPSMEGEPQVITAEDGDEYTVAVMHHSDTKLVWFENSDEVRVIGDESSVVFEEQVQATFSPDDKWLAYSDQSGEVYVARFPELSQRVRVSTDGGRLPSWSSDGTELFYVSDDGWLMVVPLQRPAESLRPGQAKRLFRMPGPFSSQYVVTDNGQRFLIKRLLPSIRGTQIRVVGNWFEELNRVAPRTSAN